MNELLVPIDQAGRIVLPKQVRDELAIHPGDRLKIAVRGNEVTLSPAREPSGFIRRGRALVFSSGEAGQLDHETVETVRSGERGGLMDNLARELSSPAHR